MKISAVHIEASNALSTKLGLSEEQKALFILWNFIKYLEKKISYKPEVSYSFNPKDKKERPLLKGIDLIEEQIFLEDRTINYLILWYIFSLLLDKHFIQNNISEGFDIYYNEILILEKDEEIINILNNIYKKVELITDITKPKYFSSIKINKIHDTLRKGIYTTSDILKERKKNHNENELSSEEISEWLNFKSYNKAIEDTQEEFIKLLKSKLIHINKN